MLYNKEKGWGYMKLKRIFASLLSLGFILSPMSVYAEDDIVAVAEDNTAYTSYQNAWNAAKSGLKIYMMQDWNLEDRLVVEENQNVTIEMNGCKINRNLGTDYEFGGEVIYLDENSTLTLTGNKYKNTEFSYKGYNRTWQPSDETLTSGGLVTGGASEDGAGGIHMKEGSKLYLENVAIAGNASTLIKNNGGAINVNNDDCEVHMTNAILGYNSASRGGGIFVDGENTIITMDASTICNNYSSMEGGGIYSNDDATYVTMTNGSTIDYNRSSEDGGGIYFDNPYCQVRSPDNTAVISNNYSYEDGGGVGYGEAIRGDTQIIEGVTFDSNTSEYSGGAIYADQKRLTFKDCVFTKNSAQASGGAVYVDASNVNFSNCTMQENSASDNGGGIYVAGSFDIYVSGKMIVENNTRSDGSKDDIYLDTNWPQKAYVSGTPDVGSSVGIRCASEQKVGIDQTEDNGSFFADEDGFKISYDDGKLYKESGSVLGSIFGNANLGAAVVVIIGIVAVGAVALIVSKRKNHVEA